MKKISNTDQTLEKRKATNHSLQIQITKVHSKSLDTYFRNRNNFYMVQYFYLIFSTGIESELLSIFSYKLYKNIVYKLAKTGTKIFELPEF